MNILFFSLVILFSLSAISEDKNLEASLKIKKQVKVGESLDLPIRIKGLSANKEGEVRYQMLLSLVEIEKKATRAPYDPMGGSEPFKTPQIVEWNQSLVFKAHEVGTWKIQLRIKDENSLHDIEVEETVKVVGN